MESQKENISAASRPQAQLWSPSFVIVILISFMLFVIGQGINGGLAVYVERVGGTATFAGILSAVFSVTAAVSRLAIGPFIDTRGRMIIAAAGTLVFGFGILMGSFVRSDAVLTVARIVQGVGFAAATTASATAAPDVLPPSRMGEGIGYFGLGQAVAMSFGPALALAILGTDPPENLFYVLTVLCAVAFALIVACRYERHPEILPEGATYRRRVESGEIARLKEGEAKQDSPSEDASDPRGLLKIFEPSALPGALPMLFLSTGIGFAISFAGLYGERLGLINAGLFFTVSAVAMIVVRMKSKSFMDVTAPIVIYGITIACGVFGFALLLAAQLVAPVFYLAGLFYGVFIGLGQPLNQSVAVKNTPPERWGAGNALVFLSNDIGIGCSSLIWGILNDSLGFSASIIGTMCCLVVSYIVARILYPKEL